MPPSSRNRHASRSLARQRDMRRFGRQTALRPRSVVAPEWPVLLAATTTATLMLRADPSYPTVALFHVSLTLTQSGLSQRRMLLLRLRSPREAPRIGQQRLSHTRTDEHLSLIHI